MSLKDLIKQAVAQDDQHTLRAVRRIYTLKKAASRILNGDQGLEALVSQWNKQGAMVQPGPLGMTPVVPPQHQAGLAPPPLSSPPQPPPGPMRQQPMTPDQGQMKLLANQIKTQQLEEDPPIKQAPVTPPAAQPPVGP